MVNKSDCSKKFKNLCDKTIFITMKEIQTAKNYSKLWNSYSTIKDSINDNMKRLHSANSLLQRKKQNIDALNQLDQDRKDELEHMEEEIKTFQDKISAIQKSDSEEAKQAHSAKLLLLRLNVLNTCTKTYINDKMLPHVIRGFAANEETVKMMPFEVDPTQLSELEVQHALWENCLKTSPYVDEWSDLFSIEPTVGDEGMNT